MTTSLRPRALLWAVLALAAAPALAQPIVADSQDALEPPGARQYGVPPAHGPRAANGQRGSASGYGAASPDLPATLSQQHGGSGYPQPYGGPVGDDGRPDYVGRDGYGSAYGYGGGDPDGAGSYGNPDTALGAPFDGGMGNRRPIPLGTGSPYSGSAVRGTAVGPQFSNQLPAYQDRSQR